jgi:hypothetical protein
MFSWRGPQRFYEADRDRASVLSSFRACASASPESMNLTDTQHIDWLRLIRSDRVGPYGIMAQMPQA